MNYVSWKKGLWLAIGSLGLLSGPIARTQSIPDTQWRKTGSTVAVTTNGNIVTTGPLPATDPPQLGAGDRVAKYSLQGDLLWETGGLKGGFYLGGKIPGVDYEAIGKIFLTAPTSDGGVAVVGKTSLQGRSVASKISAAGGYRRWEDADLFAGDALLDDLVGTPDGGFLLLYTIPQTNAPTSAMLRKYDAAGNFAWTKEIAYPTPNLRSGDRSLTKGESLINTPDGGFLVVGYYNTNGSIADLNNLAGTNDIGWVAKVDGQGNVSWQKLLNDLPLTQTGNGLVPGTIVKLIAVTDVIPAADGNGYALTGAGLSPSSKVVPTAVAAVLELNADGTFKRARSIGTAPFSESFLTMFTTTNGFYYAVGNTDRQSGTNPQVLLVNPASLPLNDVNLLNVVRQRTFDGGGFLKNIVTTGDGGLAFVSSTKQLTKLYPASPVDCNFAQPRRVGTWNGLEVQIRQYGDKRVLVTALLNSPTDKHYPRGDNFWDHFTKDAGVDALRGCLNGGNTAFPGFDAPTNLPTPSGYTTGREADGAFFFERSNGPCDFAQPRRVGTWNGLEVQIRQYGDKRVLVTALLNSPTDKHYPRGDNFWDHFTKDAGVDALRGCLNGGNTAFPGFDAPTNLPTPSGYTTGREADGAFFFEDADGVPNGQGRKGVGEPGAQLQVRVLGNPVDGRSVQVDIYGVAGQSVQIDLIDLQGRVLHQQLIGQTGSTERVTIPMHDGRGVLILNVSTATQRQSVKLMKR